MTQTIRPNNNTGLYNGGQATIPIDQNLNIVGNLSVGGSISAISNITGGNLLTPGLVSAAGNVTGANVIGVNVIGSNITGGDITGGNITGGNLLTSGQVSATGNITGNYIFGNVANATGFHPNKIFNGTSEANIGQPNGNLNININGVSNVIVVDTTGEYIQGLLSATGNITGANINTAGILSSTGNIRGANINTAGLVTASGNVTGGNIVTAGNVTGNYLLSNTVSASGNVIATNINVSSISATGNITGGNVNVNNNLDVTGDVGIDGNLVVDGNIAGAYLSGDGRNLTLSTYGGVLNPSSLSSTGAVVAAVLQTSGAVGNIIGVNYAVANYFVGDGTYLTNVTSAGSSVTNGTSSVAVAYNGNTTVAVAGNTVGTFASSGFNVSGAISATGNITGNYFKGNGSQLTGITTTYNNSNVTSLLAAFGSNSISTSGNITAGNALINNQLAVSGDLEAYNGMTMHNGNIVVGISGQTVITPTTIAVQNLGSGPTITPTSISGPISISATGNITGNYIFGNGSQLTGIAAGYGNSNVVTLLAAFGSNTISTSGNVTVGNLTVSGTETDTGNITGGNLLTGGVVSATGNVTGNYFIGNGSALTGITATAGPGGANTQLQFNNAGSLAGNSNMTFDVTSGNVVVGNIYYNGLNIVPGGQVPNVLPTGNTNPSRLVIGQGYNGNLNWAYNQNGPGLTSGTGPGARVLISDTYNYSSSSGATRIIPLALQNYITLTANVTGSNTVYNGALLSTMIGGGASANTGYVNIGTAFSGLNTTISAGYTQNANLSAVGNTSISFMTGIRSGPVVNYGSNVDVVIGVLSSPTQTNNGTTSYANIGNLVAYTTNFGGGSGNANVIQNAAAVAYYHPGPLVTNTILQSPNVGASVTTGNIARMSTSYYAFRNDDDLAMTKLGSLSQFHEYSYGNNSTTGSITINKTNGQVQYIPLTGSLTISGFSNFVTSVTRPNASINYQTDTVTLILNQGATGGYSVTLPTGANYKYAGGANTVGATANAVTMISVTGFYNTATSATNYLLTISPEFA